MAELKRFPASEIALHTTKKDCWLTIEGKVYDVTEFLEDHPGGEEVLLQASGNGDATQAFEDVGHSSSAKSMMKSYLIGALEGYDEDAQAALREKAEGRKKREVSGVQSEGQHSFTLVDYLLPLLILFVAIFSWYMLTFHGGPQES